MHKHVDIFIEQMKAVGGGESGAEMKKWADWLSMDLSADMTYNRQMNQMKDSEWLHAGARLRLARLIFPTPQ